jgi:hypothetical protein
MFSFVAKWCKRQDGAAAIEFSMLAVPFFFIVIAIIELSLLFAAQAIFQDGVFSAARLIRTGQLQTDESGGDPRDLFRAALCAQEMAIIDCNDIDFTVQTLDNFTQEGTSPAMDGSGRMATTDADGDGNPDPLPFDAGGISSVVRIDATYLYPFLTFGLGRFFSDYPGEHKLLTSTVIMQVEPYGVVDDGS